jgi:hypothetical protein
MIANADIRLPQRTMVLSLNANDCNQHRRARGALIEIKGGVTGVLDQLDTASQCVQS